MKVRATVRLMRSILCLGAALLSIGACSGDSSGDLPTITTETVLDDYPSALIEGKIGAVDISGTVYFTIDAEGVVYGLVFPPDHDASLRDSAIVVHSSEEIVAESGQMSSLGGGEYPQGETLWDGGPEVDGLWLVSP